MGLTPLSAGGGGGGGQTWGGEVRVAYQTTLDAALRETAALGESMHHEWALRLEAERESTRRQLYDLRQLAEADSRERVQQVWCAGRSDTGYHTHAPNSNASGSVCLCKRRCSLGTSVRSSVVQRELRGSRESSSRGVSS